MYKRQVYTATKGGQLAGYAVESMTKNGFGGAINMMVGFTPDGEVINVNVLKPAETPGLGTKMADADNVLLRLSLIHIWAFVRFTAIRRVRSAPRATSTRARCTTWRVISTARSAM